ncbi:hypothetical protein RHDC1_01890 [Rhodocyclaceae bacterium]|jgi:hypothetical protein|nr:hypothetical protein RHDC1_01890 [Rhodocyclaceae bacterium]
MKLKRNRLLVAALLALAAAGAGAEPLPEVVMHKDPNCGCCGQWAEYLQANGFRVKTVMEDDMQSVKRRFAVPQRLTSCHTAKVGDYVIEGHVPASAIKRLLREKPAVAGLSVPGMPLGSPGMEVPGKKDAYDVVAFDKAGKIAVFESHR